MTPADFEQRLYVDPADPALDAAALQLGAAAQARLVQLRALEQELRQALECPLPAGLLADLQQLPAQPASAASADSDPPQALLVAALAVDVPASLAADLASLPQRAHPRTAHWFRRITPLALAASLLLAVALFLGWRDDVPARIDPVLAASVEHLSHEPFALTRTEIVPPQTVSGLLAQVGLRLEQPVPVNYAYPCGIAGERTIHMVMQEAGGPVTVIYFRSAAAPEKAAFSHLGMNGRSLRYGDGMLVLIGSDSRDFDRVEQRWRGALEGSA